MNRRVSAMAMPWLGLCLLVAGCQYGKYTRPVAPMGDSTLGFYVRMLQGDHFFSDLGTRGVPRMMVTRVAPGGPADRAGIKPGAILLRVDGHTAHNPESMIRLVRNLTPGRDVEVKLIQDDRRVAVKVHVERSQEVWGWRRPDALPPPVEPAEVEASLAPKGLTPDEIGRASCRERVCHRV